MSLLIIRRTLNYSSFILFQQTQLTGSILCAVSIKKKKYFSSIPVTRIIIIIINVVR